MTSQLLQSQHPSPAAGLPLLWLTTYGMKLGFAQRWAQFIWSKILTFPLAFTHIFITIDPWSPPIPQQASHKLQWQPLSRRWACGTFPFKSFRVPQNFEENNLWAVFNNHLYNVIHFQPPPAYAEQREMLICRGGRNLKDRLPRRAVDCAMPENSRTQQGGLNIAHVITLSPKRFCNSMPIS